MTQTKRLNLMFLILVIVYLGGSYLYSTLLSGIEHSVYLDIAVSQLLVLLPAIGYMKLNHRSFQKHVWHRPLKGSAGLCLIGCMILSMPLLAFLNFVSSLMVGNAAQELAASVEGGPFLLNVLFLALIPACVEELVFRGLLFQGYRRHGLWKAMFLSGLFFGLLHLNFNQFSYGFVLGMVSALLMEVTGSVYAPMLLHFLINFQSVCTIESLSQMTVEQGEAAALQLEQQVEASAAMQQSFLSVTVLVLFVIALAAAGLLVLLIRFLAKLSGREDYFAWVTGGGEKAVLSRRRGEPAADLYLAGAVVICLGVMIFRLF